MSNDFDMWQYTIFKWVLFILFLAAAYRLLNNDLHLNQFFGRLFRGIAELAKKVWDLISSGNVRW
jgi:hypothetical protein